MNTLPRSLTTYRGGAAHEWQRLSGNGRSGSGRSPAPLTDEVVPRRRRLEAAPAGGGELRPALVAPIQHLGGGPQRTGVLFLQAVGAPDVVHAVLVRRGAGAARGLFPDVLVGERAIVRIADADRLVLARDLRLFASVAPDRG